jgi:hypothetical protein
MPKTIDPSELTRLLERIGRFSHGVQIDELLRAMRHKLSRRTLQRRLAQLVADKRLEMHGAGRQTTYCLPAPTANANLTDAADTVTASAEVYVPLRAESEALKLQVRRPLTLRKPVGYDLGLLDAYEPNVTFYLDASLREQLLALGPQPAADRLVMGVVCPRRQHLQPARHAAPDRARTSRRRQGRARDANDLEPQERNRVFGS